MTDKIQKRVEYIKEDPTKPYLIRYKIEVGRYGREDIGEKEGATQDLITISCITHPDGSYSQVWNAVNGQTGEALDNKDVFKAWIMMCPSLRDKEDIDDDTREFLRVVFETYREAIFGGK